MVLNIFVFQPKVKKFKNLVKKKESKHFLLDQKN